MVFEALHREYSVRHQVKVVSGSTGAPTDARADRANRVTRVPEIPIPRHFRYLATTLPPTLGGLRCLLRTIRDVDVVHAHGFGFPVVDTGIRLAARCGIPVLQTFHGYPVSQTKRGAAIKWAFRAYHRFSGFPALRRAEGYTAVSQPVADLYRRKYRLVVATIPNGVDLPDEADWPELDPLVESDRRLLVSVGRLEWIKGGDSLIHALRMMQANLRPEVLFIGRDHGEGQHLRELAHKSGIGDLCHFVGAQPRGRVARALRLADVCVVTSHTEAFPAVPLEAMLAGTAVVTSRLPSVQAYAREGVNCEMFTPGDEHELASKLARVLHEVRLQDKLVAGGLAAAACFRWPSVAGQYELLLDRLAS